MRVRPTLQHVMERALKIIIDEDKKRYLTSRMVRERYVITDMTLWRWLNCPKHAHLKFPKPLVINYRKLFALDELEAWERDQKRRPAKHYVTKGKTRAERARERAAAGA